MPPQEKHLSPTLPTPGFLPKTKNETPPRPFPACLNSHYSSVLARTIANVPTLPRETYPYRMFM